MTTLREILDYGELGHTFEEFRALIESWAYGEERECPECGGDPRNPRSGGLSLNVVRSIAQAAECLCHGTGKVKGPGLVERVLRQTDEMTLEQGVYVAVALRQELGEDALDKGEK